MLLWVLTACIFGITSGLAILTMSLTAYAIWRKLVTVGTFFWIISAWLLVGKVMVMSGKQLMSL